MRIETRLENAFLCPLPLLSATLLIPTIQLEFPRARKYFALDALLAPELGRDRWLKLWVIISSAGKKRTEKRGRKRYEQKGPVGKKEH